jgi:hypothetical protein
MLMIWPTAGVSLVSWGLAARSSGRVMLNFAAIKARVSPVFTWYWVKVDAAGVGELVVVSADVAVAVDVGAAPATYSEAVGLLVPERKTPAKATDAISRTAAMAPKTTSPERRRGPRSRPYGGGAAA